MELPRFENIPDTMKSAKAWTWWHYVTRNGQPTKPPCDSSGRDWDITKNAVSFSAAVDGLQNGANLAGIGFELRDGVAGADFDDCIVDGVINPETQKVVDALDSYTEVSPSGSGVKVFLRGRLPGDQHVKLNVCGAKKVELYDAGRFFTVTGRVLPKSPATVNERQEQLDALYRKVFGAEDQHAKPCAPFGKWRNVPDEKIIEQLCGVLAYEKLWKYGNTEEQGGDDSAADFKLACRLAYYTGRDAERIDRLFRQSKLMRPKWDERRGALTYGARTVRNAVAEQVEVWEPPTRKLTWESLETEDDILAAQGSEIKYVVDEIIPEGRVTMLFGREKNGKSILALDLCKHVANGKPWLNRHTVKTPCLYVDYEDGILGMYVAWLRGVGEEKVRFKTLRSKNGIPALDDPELLALCAELHPLIVLDSLHKLFGRNKDKQGSAWRSSDYEPVLQKIRQLALAGATVVVIHHATKADEELYLDSAVIGANFDFFFAVVGDEPVDGVKRVHLRGKPSRGAYPPTLHLFAFPHIIEQGHLCVDAGLDQLELLAKRAVKDVDEKGPTQSKRDLAKRMRGKTGTALKAINAAIDRGWLVVSASGEVNLGSETGLF